MKNGMKRCRTSFILAVFAALLALVCLPAQSWGEETCPDDSEGLFAGGAGTAECPYLIATADQLNNVRHDLGAHYKLIADIDLGVAPYNQGAGWLPIGKGSPLHNIHDRDPFTGTFDGDGHKIINLLIKSGGDGKGLFAATDTGATIRNIGLVNVNVQGNSSRYVGSLVGWNTGVIENAYATGSVNGASYVGGLVGQNDGTLSGVYAASNVSGDWYIGGLAGTVSSEGGVYNAYAKGTVSGARIVGGLLGSVNGTVSHAYAMGFVHGDGTVGGLVGSRGTSLPIVSSYYDWETTGRSDTGKGERKSTAEMKQLGTFASWDFNNVWYMRENHTYPRLRWEEASWPDYSGFNADLEVPGKKYTGEAFNLSITGARGVFENALSDDIPVTIASDQDGDVYNGTVTFANGNAGVPVTLNTAGTHTLSIQVEGITNPQSVEVEAEAVFAGGDGTEASPYLIATADQLNKVRDYLNAHFRLIADIDLNVEPYNQGEGWVPIGTVGDPFAGSLDGGGHKISNLIINRPDQDYVGLFSATRHNAEIRNIGLEHVNVTGRNQVGALVGLDWANISNVFVTGSVTGKVYVGCQTGQKGLGQIENAYAVCSVTGFDSVGGLIGHYTGGTITNTYAAGPVTGERYDLGGLIGSRGTSQPIVSSFYDRETTGRSENIGNGTPKSTAEMKQLGTFAGWDFEQVWHIRENHTYPRLRWEEANWQDYSGFDAVPGVPGSKTAGEAFDLAITNARGVFDNALNGNIPVTIASNKDGHLYNGSATFANGNAAVLVTLNEIGTHTLTIQVNEVTASRTVEVQVIAALASIAVTTPPSRTEYFVGEELDLTGLVVTGTYTDNSQQVLPVTTAHVSGFDSSAPKAGQVITVTWEGKTATFTVDIVEPVLASIVITTPPSRTEYFVGEELDLTGLVVTGTYTDNRQQVLPVTTAHVSGFDSSAPKAGQVITVTWEGKTATFTVTIADKPDTEAPTVPANFRNTGKTATAVSLAWDESVDHSGVSHYELEVKQGSADWEQAAAPIGTAHTLTGLSPSTAYTFRVRAVDESGNRSGWSEELTVVTNSIGNSGNAGGNASHDGGGDREWFIDINGQAILPTDIDTSAPSIILQVAPEDIGSDYAIIPVSILNDFAAQNPNFVMEIQAPYGSYLLPAALPSLVPGWEALLEERGWKPDTIAFKLTMNDRTENADIREALSVRLPNGKLIGTAVEFHLEMVDVNTGEVLTEISRFTEPVIRTIPVSSEDFEPGAAMWGAFRYDEASGGFVFVPARLEERDDRLVVVILSRSNSVYAAVENAVSFTDTERHWGKIYAEQAAAKGLVNGVGGGKFAPDRPVTRAEITVMLVRAWGRGTSAGTSSPYDDVIRGAWYFGEVAAAKELGLLKFVDDDHFRPDQPLTREELAGMLAAAVRLEMQSVPKNPSRLTGYRDQADMNPDLIDDIRLMTVLGIMIGTGSEQFSPKMEVTRAQAAAVLARALATLGWIDGLQEHDLVRS